MSSVRATFETRFEDFFEGELRNFTYPVADSLAAYLPYVPSYLTGRLPVDAVPGLTALTGQEQNEEPMTKPYLPRTEAEVLAHNNSLFDDHSYVGFTEPLVSYDFRPYTPPYYEGFCYAEYIFKPEREGKHTLDEIFEKTRVEFYRKRDKIKYSNTLETEPYVPNYWHINAKSTWNTDNVTLPNRHSEYHHWLNPKALKEKVVGAPHHEYVKMFPDLTSSDPRGYEKIIHLQSATPLKTTGTDIFPQYIGTAYSSIEGPFAKGGKASGKQVANRAFTGQEYSDFLKTRVTDPDSPKFLDMKRSYGDATELELMTYLPNKLKTKKQAYSFCLLDNEITSPRMSSVEINHTPRLTPGTGSFRASLHYDVGENYYDAITRDEAGYKRLKITFSEPNLSVVNNLESFKATSRTYFKTTDQVARDLGQPLETLPLSQVFQKGSIVSIKTSPWDRMFWHSRALNAARDNFDELDYTDFSTDIPEGEDSSPRDDFIRLFRTFFDISHFGPQMAYQSLPVTVKDIPSKWPAHGLMGMILQLMGSIFSQHLTMKVESVNEKEKSVTLVYHSGAWSGHTAEITKITFFALA